MQRVTGEDLLHHIYVLILTTPKPITNRLRSKLPHDGDAAANKIAAMICRTIDNDSYMFTRTERFGLAPETHLGTWGIDDPDPTA